MQLQKHVILTHLPSLTAPEGVCSWTDCDPLTRRKWSLITHIHVRTRPSDNENRRFRGYTISVLQDKHLNEEGCRASSLRRQQHQQAPMASPQVAATPPVYPKDAAVQAIRRFAMKPPYAEFTVSQPKPWIVKSMTAPL